MKKWHWDATVDMLEFLESKRPTMSNVDEEVGYSELSYFFMEAQTVKRLWKKFSQLLVMKQFNEPAILLPGILVR